jgi:LmbE family N-acetylglucosaminyl deacetylase
VLTGSILVVAAHPDDEVLGMGGSIRKFTSRGQRVAVLFLSDGVTSRNIHREDVRSRKRSALSALQKIGCEEVYFADFPDNQLDTISMLLISKEIEKIVAVVQPQSVFTHFPFDLNIDHQVVSEAVSIATRPKKSSKVSELLFFEVLSSTGWKFGSRAFTPTLYIDIEDEYKGKFLALLEYESELDPYPNARSLEAVEALATLRGATVGSLKCEAFEVGFIRA